MSKPLPVHLGFIIVCCGLFAGCLRFPPPSSLRLAADPARLRETPPPASTGVSGALVPDPVRIEPEKLGNYAELPTSVTKIYDRPPTLLSIPDVVLQDLANNRAIKIRRFEARIAQYGLPAAQGIYDLLLRGNYRYNWIERQAGRPPNLTVNRSDNQSGSVGVSQLLPTGATVSVDYDANRDGINDYGNETTIELRQPLLQGLGWAVTNTNIQVAALNSQAGEWVFRTVVQDQLSAALTTYWNLIGLIQALKVVQISYAAAQDLHRVNLARYEVGLISIADYLQTEAAMAARYGAIIQARQLVRDTEDRLKLQLFLDQSTTATTMTQTLPEGRSPDWSLQLLPTQPIAWRELAIDVDQAVAEALRRRPELAAARTDVSAARVLLDLARNTMLPVLDFIGSLIPNGVSQGTRNGGFDEAFQNMAGSDAMSYVVGLEFSFPLQNRAARYRHRQAQARLLQSEERLKDTADQVTQEVREAARDYASARQRIDVTLAQIASEEANLETERLRLDVGLSTTFRVLQFQQDLANAQLQHIQAVIQANNAAIALERAQGTLLETYGVSEE